MRVAFYKFNRPGLKGFFDRLIRIVTSGPYSHCELIFSDGAAFSSSIQDNGCRFARIDFDPERWDIIDITADEAAARCFCNGEVGALYDFPGVFRFLCPNCQESPERWFCSEIVCAALQAGGMLPGAKAWQVHPNLLHQLLTGGQA